MNETTCHDECVVVPRRQYSLFATTFWFLVIAAAYGTVQVWLMSSFLKDHSHYVRSRDVEWREMFDRHEQHMNQQDIDLAKVKENQVKILNAIMAKAPGG